MLIGIDIGTAYIRAVCLNKKRYETWKIPAVVFFKKDGTIIVGTEVEKLNCTTPSNRISYIKTKIQDGLEKAFCQSSNSFSPQYILEILLKRFFEKIQSVYSFQNFEAIITIPPTFSPVYRHVIKMAFENIGVTIRGVIWESIASVLHLLKTELWKQRIIMVCDFGESSFNVSIIRTGGNVAELITAISTKDISTLELDWELFKEICRRGGIETTSIIGKSIQLMYDKCRYIREQIAINHQNCFHVNLQTSNFEKIEFDITSEDVKKLYYSRIKCHLQEIIDKSLNKSGVHRQNIDSIIVTGGGFCLSCIRTLMRHIIGPGPQTFLNSPSPQWIIAKGALDFAIALDSACISQSLHEEPVHPFATCPLSPTDLYCFYNEYDNLDGRSITTKHKLMSKGLQLPCEATPAMFIPTGDKDGNISVNIQDEHGKDLLSIVATPINARPLSRSLVRFELIYDKNGKYVCTLRELFDDVVLKQSTGYLSPHLSQADLKSCLEYMSIDNDLVSHSLKL